MATGQELAEEANGNTSLDIWRSGSLPRLPLSGGNNSAASMGLTLYTSLPAPLLNNGNSQEPLATE
jgi:hypothetical protein